MKLVRQLVSGLLLVAACGAADAPPNAADVYRRAFEALPKLTDAESQLLRGQPSGVNAAALSLKLAPALEIYRQAARMENCDWGFDLQKTGPETLLPHISPLMNLSRAAAWEAERVKATDPAAFVAWHEDALRSSAHAGAGALMISGLVEASMRMRSLGALCTNLAALPPDLLAKLGTQLAALPPPQDFQKIMQGEKAFCIDWFIRRLFDKQREQQTAATATNFAARLRMSAMVAGGPVGLKIGLEGAGGDNFWLGLGQRRHGIELVSADLKRGEAVLFKNGQAALVLLQEKRIEPINLKLINDELSAVLGKDEAGKMLKGAGSNSMQLVRQLMETSDLMGAIAAASAAPVKDPEAWGKAIQEEQRKAGNVFTALLLPAIGTARARMDAAHAQELMLRVAVDVLREGPAAAARSRDPWGDGAPFTCRQTADGIELVSQLQNKGASVSLHIPRH
jgi:hypothetical protein